MFPVVMLVLNVSSVAVLWFGGIRVDAGMMEIGSLTAFLSYLVQILMSVMMATFMLVMMPAGLGLGRSHRRGARHGVFGGASDQRRHRVERQRRARVARCWVQLSRRQPPGAVRCVVHGPTRADHGHHRLDRCRQDHPPQPDSAAFRRHRRHRCWSTGSTSATRPGHAVGQDRAGAPEALFLLGHGGLQPSLRQARCHG